MSVSARAFSFEPSRDFGAFDDPTAFVFALKPDEVTRPEGLVDVFEVAAGQGGNLVGGHVLVGGVNFQGVSTCPVRRGR